MNITFATPALLAGLLAGAIPLALHLLASVRAPARPFPSLRFIRLSMQRTARRRHVQHWLLLVLRSLMLALLAIAAAEPISHAAGLTAPTSSGTAVIILDNSMSMATRSHGQSRFDIAHSQIANLLNGSDKPSSAILLPTNGPAKHEWLTMELDDCRRDLAATRVTGQSAAIADNIAHAYTQIALRPDPTCTIYVFSDLQQASSASLASLAPPAGDSDIPIVIIDAGDAEAENVSVADLTIAGHRVLNETLTITATLTNSSQSSRVVDVSLRVGDGPASQRTRVTLAAEGDGRSEAVRFRHRITSSQAITGAVVIETPDDLPDDNIKRFSLTPAESVRAVLVAGPGHATDTPLLSPSGLLALALDPYDGPTAGGIHPAVIAATDLTQADLTDVDAAFFCEVPAFTAAQAAAIDAFVRRGGLAVFLPGRGLQAGNYNELLADDDQPGLLPAALGKTVGQIGPTAPAVASDWVDADHPYLAGLYAASADYPPVLVHRYIRMTPTDAGRPLLSLPGGDPLIVSKTHGRGNIILSAVPASPQWSDMMIRGMVPAMFVRATMMSPGILGRDNTYTVGDTVTVSARLPEGVTDIHNLRLEILSPDDSISAGEPFPLVAGPAGAEASFTAPTAPGEYRWHLIGPDVASWDRPVDGVFAVNAVAGEGDLARIAPEDLTGALTTAGIACVTLADSLTSAAADTIERAKGDNWWDVLLIAVAAALLVEVAIANRTSGRQGRGASPSPAN